MYCIFFSLIKIVCLVINSHFVHLRFLAVWIGITPTIYESSFHTSKGFTGGEVQTEATRENENFVGCKLFCQVLNDTVMSSTDHSLREFLLVFFLLLKALKTSNYGAEPLLQSCGISISTGFTQVEGRVLPAPKVYFLLLWSTGPDCVFLFIYKFCL